MKQGVCRTQEIGLSGMLLKVGRPRRRHYTRDGADFLVPGEDAVDHSTKGRLDAASAHGASVARPQRGGGAAALLLSGIPGIPGAGEVAGATPADVVAVGHLFPDVGTGELILERDGWALEIGVGVAGAAPTAVEACGAGGGDGCVGSHRRDGCWYAGGRCSWGCAEEVACSSPAGVGVCICADGWMRLGDQKTRHIG